MKPNPQNIFVLLFGLILVALVIFAGCDEKEVYTLSQEEEVERYITDSYLGQAFFSNAFMTGTVTYSLPGEDTVYTETVNSVRRVINVYDLDSTVELSTGTYYYANVMVGDYASTTVRREVLGDVTEWSSDRSMVRYGFLVKLGTNAHEYSGWLLQGYATGYTDAGVTTVGGETLRLNYVDPLVVAGTDLTYESVADRDYMDIDNASSISDSSLIVFDGCDQCAYVVFYEANSGGVNQVVPDGEAGTDCVADTIQIATTDNLFWSFLAVRSICREDDSTTTSRTEYLPFRVTQ